MSLPFLIHLAFEFFGLASLLSSGSLSVEMTFPSFDRLFTIRTSRVNHPLSTSIVVTVSACSTTFLTILCRIFFYLVLQTSPHFSTV